MRVRLAVELVLHLMLIASMVARLMITFSSTVIVMFSHRSCLMLVPELLVLTLVARHQLTFVALVIRMIVTMVVTSTSTATLMGF